MVGDIKNMQYHRVYARINMENIRHNLDSVKNKIAEFFMETENITEAFSFNADFTSVDIDTTKFSKAVDVEATLSRVYENAKNDKYVLYIVFINPRIILKKKDVIA